MPCNLINFVGNGKKKREMERKITDLFFLGHAEQPFSVGGPFHVSAEG